MYQYFLICVYLQYIRINSEISKFKELLVALNLIILSKDNIIFTLLIIMTIYFNKIKELNACQSSTPKSKKKNQLQASDERK